MNDIYLFLNRFVKFVKLFGIDIVHMNILCQNELVSLLPMKWMRFIYS